ncbi:MAG TPA: hypothetical protein VFI68_11180 [Anaerolineales bacterium]|nr:hypothetical protein [Anaerolineales bacterium]
MTVIKLHVMLIGLKHDLIAGDELIVTLYFNNREDIVLTVPVLAAENMDVSAMEGHTP